MVSAFVLINVALGSEEDVITKLRSIKDIKEAHRVYGVYDTIIKVESESVESLKDIVSSNIRKLPSVRSTLTMIIIQ
ncbi:MAG: Lrp/AsnC family transcriptional regulator [Candidatus Hodarchaeales archaeon]